jgi:hypothetical protein
VGMSVAWQSFGNFAPCSNSHGMPDISAERLRHERALYKRVVLAFFDVTEACLYLERLRVADNSGDEVMRDAFVTAFVIGYGRCFADSRSGPGALVRLPDRLLRALDPAELALHHRLMNLRNTEFAHSDADAANVQVSPANAPVDFLVPQSRALRTDSLEASAFGDVARLMEKLYIFIHDEMLRLNHVLAPHGRF